MSVFWRVKGHKIYDVWPAKTEGACICTKQHNKLDDDDNDNDDDDDDDHEDDAVSYGC